MIHPFHKLVRVSALSAAASLFIACGGTQEPSTTTVPPATTGEEAPAVEAIPEAFAAGPAPHLVVKGASDAIAFYTEIFGAKPVYSAAPDAEGRVMHAMIAIGDSMITLSDEYPGMGPKSPATLGGTTAQLMVYVDDADATFKKAVAAGAKAVMPVQYMFWGDRYGVVTDPFGHQWGIATHVMDVSPEDMQAGVEAMMAGKKIEQPEGASAKPVPEGMHTVTVALTVKDVDKAMAFYEKALGATAGMKFAGPNGKTFHAEMKIRNQTVMLSPEMVQRGHKSPATLGGSPVHLTYYVDDAAAAFDSAVAAGATAKMPVTKMFWGDDWGTVVDPSGHLWSVATHVEDVSPEEMAARAKEMMSGHGGEAAETAEPPTE